MRNLRLLRGLHRTNRARKFLEIRTNLNEFLQRIDLCELINHLRGIHWIEWVLRLQFCRQQCDERIGVELI